ncbi:isoprenylcysteine carboxylmethyltransferase family protein [Mesorhizobium sp. BAC0120]|uniref:methyltransferase family protein n=1 Tax=Mesorhizobium sp. BAC0120 TaxID=3090670 RepID=UPI00298C6F48|nr:isoprenylcysteine carboxylmethyltransferase family protein [Mesorhizobium sp. BAC0120]MDW6020328.1 isoprenylcysteine carboxylmethyltransferase family protein [Mesorhizobium sp. BAC0120]
MINVATRPSLFPWPPLIYVAAIAISIELWVLHPLPWFGSPMSDILFAVGCIALVAVVALYVSAVRELAKAKTTIQPHRASTQLVTSGAFSVTRNPIYLGNTLLMLAVAVIWGNLWFVPLAVIAAFLTQKLAIEGEEKHLAASFGKRYADYKRRVRRWI